MTTEHYVMQNRTTMAETMEKLSSVTSPVRRTKTGQTNILTTQVFCLIASTIMRPQKTITYRCSKKQHSLIGWIFRQPVFNPKMSSFDLRTGLQKNLDLDGRREGERWPAVVLGTFLITFLFLTTSSLTSETILVK